MFFKRVRQRIFSQAIRKNQIVKATYLKHCISITFILLTFIWFIGWGASSIIIADTGLPYVKVATILLGYFSSGIKYMGEYSDIKHRHHMGALKRDFRFKYKELEV